MDWRKEEDVQSELSDNEASVRDELDSVSPSRYANCDDGNENDNQQSWSTDQDLEVSTSREPPLGPTNSTTQLLSPRLDQASSSSQGFGSKQSFSETTKKLFLRSPKKSQESPQSGAGSRLSSPEPHWDAGALSPSSASGPFTPPIGERNQRNSGSHVSNFASMLKSPVSPHSYENRRRSASTLEQQIIGNAPSANRNPGSPHAHMLDTNLSAIKAGLDQALGLDGNGAWLAHETPNAGKQESGEQQDRERISQDDYFGKYARSRNSSVSVSPSQPYNDSDELSLAIPSQSYVSDKPLKMGKFPQLHLDTSAMAHRRNGSLTSAETGIPQSSKSPSRPHSESFNWSSVMKNVSGRVIGAGDAEKQQHESEPAQDAYNDKLSRRDDESDSASSKSFNHGSDANSHENPTPTAPEPLLMALPEENNGEAEVNSLRIVNSHDAGGSLPPLRRRDQGRLDERHSDVPHNFLTGNSLGVFAPDNRLRAWLHEVLLLPWIDPLVFTLILLQTILLSYRNSSNVFGSYDASDVSLPILKPWGNWTDWFILGIFVAYTFEIAAKSIVYGFLEDSESTFRQRVLTWWISLKGKSHHSIDGLGMYTATNELEMDEPLGFKAKRRQPKYREVPTFMRSFTALMNATKVTTISHNRAFLRSSWNRVDFVAVLCYWISLIMYFSNKEDPGTMLVFRAISCIRIWRLLNLTRGTSAILRALKKATPLLGNVVIFIGFFWLLFSMIGVQSFRGSLRRTCVWVDPTGVAENYTTSQFCGSYLHPDTLEVMPYVFEDGSPGPQAKGFTCPVNSLCVSSENPYGGTLSFDNIFNSIEEVFVIMSSNTYSDILYDTIDTDFLVSSLFFISGIVVLSLWLISLLIAVIASSFKLVREELINSDPGRPQRIRDWFSSQGSDHLEVLRRTKRGRWYLLSHWLWRIIIVADLIVQCSYSDSSSVEEVEFIYHWQVFTTSALVLEMVVRFFMYLPHWRKFFYSKSNIMDVFLAIITIIIILPPIYKHKEVYAWLSVFQLIRFYRVAMAVPTIQNLFLKIFGNSQTIFNLIVFFFLMSYLGSIVACEMLRGLIGLEDSQGETNYSPFFDLANSFVALYTISSTENWTDIMYAAVEGASNDFTRMCYGLFFVSWFILSNFIVLNMFVAVITENLDVPQDIKREAQIKSFVNEYALKVHNTEYLASGLKLVRNIFKKPKRSVATSASVFDMLLEKRVVEDFLDYESGQAEPSEDSCDNEVATTQSEQQTEPGANKKAFQASNDVASIASRATRPDFRTRFLRRFRLRKKQAQDPFSDLNAIELTTRPTEVAREFLNVQSKRHEKHKRYVAANPQYDKSLWIFNTDSKVRRLCQHLVASSYGDRISGVNPIAAWWYTFFAFTLLATGAMVVIACINTPLYYKGYADVHGLSANNWITYTDAVFVMIFTLEAVIKVIADGLLFSPNAYLKSNWNRIDLFVLITMCITLVSEAFFNGYVSRFIRAFVAFRSLRLLSISNRAQKTFHDVIIVGFGKILGAALISFSLLFPFAIWGLNLYSGRLKYCTDSGIGSFNNCVDEFMGTPFDWDVLSPRAVTNDYYDYDSFSHSLLIQFEVISLEGWVDVLNSVMSITGNNSNPEPFASRYNGIYPILYNILSTIFILTLFIAVIIKNFSMTRGTAFLTDEQLNWYEVSKVLGVIKPEPTPPFSRPGSFRDKMIRQILGRHTWLHYFETALLTIAATTLLSDFYSASETAQTAISVILFIVGVAYELIYLVKLYSLGWRLFINRSWWNIYGIIICAVSMIFSAVGLDESSAQFFYTIQRLGSVGMMFLWIPRSAKLDQLFQTASASFQEIGNLLLTWFVLFLAYAIAFNQAFGLTRIGPNGSSTVNFRTVPKALILLFRMSTGEGWNQVLSDFLVSPPFCVDGALFTESDCGSHPFAYFLFISWNILSMYIFVNMFVSLIYENFSYVFHRNKSHISKEDVEKFKLSWQKFDPHATGFIAQEDLPRLLRDTEGYFSMRIYDGEYTIPELLKEVKVNASLSPYEVDIPNLQDILRMLPISEVQRRRRQFDTFCTHIKCISDTRGISFSKLILQFPLYKSMNPSRCLKLDDYLEYAMTMRVVRGEILKSRLKGFFAMVHLHDEFLQKMAENPFNLTSHIDVDSLGQQHNRQAVNVPCINVTMADAGEDSN